MQSPQLIPMTPAFGPMNTMPFANQTGTYPNPQAFSSAAGASYGGGVSGNLAPQFPKSYSDDSNTFLQNPYGTMQRPNLAPGHIYAEMNPKLSAFPQTITIPQENVRIISSQVHPIQQHETFTAIPKNQKYSTQMSARIRYVGPPVQSDIIKPMPQVNNAHTTVITAGPTKALPIVVASAAIENSPTKSTYLTPGSKVMAEYYLDRKWYPAVIRHYDNDLGQYRIEWKDKSQDDLFKLPSQVVMSGGGYMNFEFFFEELPRIFKWL